MHRSVSTIMMSLLVLGMLALVFNVQPVRASGTIYINPDGSMSPSNAPIYSADNITYTLTGNITSDAGGIAIEKNNIVLNGAGYTVTGNGKGNGITITSQSNVTAGNMTIKNFNFGIWIDSSSNNVLLDNNVTANSLYGVWIYSSDNTVLSGNNVASNSGSGIELEASSDNTVLSGNNVTANNRWGIELIYSSGNTLSGNVMDNNGYNFDVEGSSLSDFLQSVDTSNLVNGRPVYYFVNQSDIMVNPDAYPEVGYLGFVNCVNVTVQGMNLTNNGQGPLLAFTKDSRITRNNFANNRWGIDLESSSSNDLSGNNVTNNYIGQIAIALLSSCDNNTISGNALFAFTGNDQGVYLQGSCNNNTISGNAVVASVTGNGQGIILIGSCDNNTVSDNSITRGGLGIVLEDSCNSNSISGNNVTASEFNGIDIFSSCDSNDISGNNITANQNYGISLEYSSSNNTLSGNNVANNFWGISLSSSSNNSIFHNNFVNNTSQVAHSPFTGSSNNTWDDGYPSGGNYWSDYNGTDANTDGIGDAPYFIDDNNTDRNPLLARYGTFEAGAWNGTAYNVGVMTNSTLSGFQVDVAQKTISFNVTGADGSTGFCRATIPNIIVQNLWQDNYTVLLDGRPCPFNNWTDTTNTYIYINYTHSQHQIAMIPEIPLFFILPILIIATLLAIIFSRRKWSKHQTRLLTTSKNRVQQTSQ